MSAPGPSQPPERVGRYEILERLGQGGMGTVYLARDPVINRRVAIKLLKEVDRPSLRERFTREATSAGNLNHPNIITIHDVGDHQGQPFIAMEYVSGPTLAEIIRQRADLPLARKIEWIQSLCRGLSAAHHAGIVHRDVKPANLIINAHGVLKILDFGVARISDSGMTTEDSVIGTLNYMAPEQALGEAVDQRTDIFAVGSVTYELVSYTQAFSGGVRDGILQKITTLQPTPLRDVVPGLPVALYQIVDRALAKEPARRYQDAGSLELALEQVRIEVAAEQLRWQPARRGGPRHGGPPAVELTPPPSGRADQLTESPPHARDAAAYLREAQGKFLAGNLDAAADRVDKAVALDSQSTTAHDLQQLIAAAREARPSSPSQDSPPPPGLREAVTEPVRRPAAVSDSAPAQARRNGAERPRNRTAAIGLATVLAVTLGLAYFSLNGRDGTPPIASPPTTDPPVAAVPTTASQTAPVSDPLAGTSAPTVGASSTPTLDVVALQRRVRSGRWETALDELLAAQRAYPGNADVESLFRELAASAQRAAGDARRAAVTAGAAPNQPEFAEATSQEREGARLMKARADQAIRTYRQSEALFTKAATAARGAKPATDAGAVTNRPTDLPSLPVSGVVNPAGAVTGTNVPLVPPPPVTKTVESPEVAKAPTAAAPTDEEQIRKTLQDYAAAMSARDMAAVTRVLRLTDGERRNLQRDFDNLVFSRYQVAPSGPIAITGQMAEAPITLSMEVEVKVRSGRTSRSDRLRVRLEKRNGVWMIVKMN